MSINRSLHSSTRYPSRVSRRKRCIYMDDAAWKLAHDSARALNLSVSQLLSRLVIETEHLILTNDPFRPASRTEHPSSGGSGI